MKLLSFRSRKACDFLMRKGNQWKGKTMNVRWMMGLPKKKGVAMKQGIYMGTYASTKLHKSAVKRNRMRRRCREAFRLSVKNQDDLSTMQLLVSPRIASLESPFEEVLADVQMFLSVLPKWPKTPVHNPSSSTTR